MRTHTLVQITNLKYNCPLILHRLYFKTVFYSGDVAVISQLVGVLLERMVMLYNMTSFQAEVRR